MNGRKSKRRQQIIQALANLVADHGYDNAHIELIAESCQLSVPTIYRYFDSKRDIALAAISEEVVRMRLASREIIDGPWDDPIEAFTQVILVRVKNLN